MSMRELVNAQCGTQNPLNELSQQLRDRERLQQFSQHGQPMAGGPRGPMAAPSTFHMGELLRQLNPNQRPSTSTGRQWVSEFDAAPAQAIARQGPAGPWASEFMAGAAQATRPGGAGVLTGGSERTALPMAHHGAPPLFAHHSPMPIMPMERLMPAPSMMPVAAGASGKWAEDILAESEQRGAEELAELRKVARDFVAGETDSNVQGTNFFKFAEQVGGQPSTSTAERWAKEMQQEQKLEAGARDDSKFWKDLADNWSNATLNPGTVDDWRQAVEALPESYRTYRFDEVNALADDAVLNPFEEGLEKLRLGDLPSAVLLFEAAVRKDSAHAEAWQLLGTTQAQNEQDVQAIAALRQCLQLEPQNAAAMLALAVSYTNEGLQRQACEVLTEWLRANPTYGHLVQANEAEAEGVSDQAKVMSILEGREHKRVLDTYIRAAQINPDAPDPDIQSCLGVLLSLSGDFDKAVDCFRAAVAVRPEDSLLWNRLGASLANGGRSEEAVEAYRRSLELQPGFIRARFNLGITCINLGAYQEAAEHFLTALSIQDNAKAEAASGVARSIAMSDNIWNTLRMVLTLMNRTDLYPTVDERNLAQLNTIFLKPTETAAN